MKILTVIGARPQFIKACLLSKLFKEDPTIKEILVHTGQHYNSNMSDVFFTQLQLPFPDYNLSVGSGSHGTQTANMIIELEQVMINEKPDLVLVYGDTNSTIAGSLTAAKLHIPIIHVESGLRSFNKQMPEEINRVVTDHLSTLLFCPSQTAVDNLKQEGIRTGVHLTGDIMYDAVLYYKDTAIKQSQVLSRLNVKPKDYYLATIHRAENTDDPKRLKGIMEGFQQLDKQVILPLHPRTKKTMEQWNGTDITRYSNITFIEPLDYFDMLVIENQAKLILTDSGGVQKEAFMMRVPCITLREETEWRETVNAGWNIITPPSNPETLLAAVSKIQEPRQYPNLFGNGRAADKMYQVIKKLSFPV
ncbi:non-hydrolyzing UDP-N-acetylglucosamine 2-epimerase [Shouchella shacheensis]|uniref:non-hydrolyzing UDP-N-acetylglucosamine 2-epimerase n=1 Tax=Shouchella shacheensis TaxID=1649580 RepID=UPI0007402277|nr:UDP-N-acetylglucosamine 2-epimerase (non-hydrolyzing) [Shouchella shacheensis]